LAGGAFGAGEGPVEAAGDGACAGLAASSMLGSKVGVGVVAASLGSRPPPEHPERARQATSKAAGETRMGDTRRWR
jgi:hypothetical protein